MKAIIAIMKIERLYYITDKENLPSILEHGICSYDRVAAEGLRPYPISNGSLTEPCNTRIALGKDLRFYARLYFQPRNAMMYRMVHQKAFRDLAVVGIKKEVLDGPDTVITDGNATHEVTQFYGVEEGLKILGRQRRIIQGDWWQNADGSKRKIMAECLVPNRVKISDIDSIYAADSTARDAIQKIVGDSFEVSTAPDMFFQPCGRIEIGQNIALIEGGDLFFSQLQTLTVTVNLRGVMGKGIALRAREQFPDVYVAYENACRAKKITAARPYVYKREASVIEELMDCRPSDVGIVNARKWFLLFATKRHWRSNSRIEDIEDGLKWLEKYVHKAGIRSVAMSALGCALGKLDWGDVAPLMCRYLHGTGIPVEIYLPREYRIPPEHLDESYLLL